MVKLSAGTSHLSQCFPTKCELMDERDSINKIGYVLVSYQTVVEELATPQHDEPPDVPASDDLDESSDAQQSAADDSGGHGDADASARDDTLAEGDAEREEDAGGEAGERDDSATGRVAETEDAVEDEVAAERGGTAEGSGGAELCHSAENSSSGDAVGGNTSGDA